MTLGDLKEGKKFKFEGKPGVFIRGKRGKHFKSRISCMNKTKGFNEMYLDSEIVKGDK